MVRRGAASNPAALAGVAILLTLMLAGGGARAQMAVDAPPGVAAVLEQPPTAVIFRPRMSAAVGMGMTFDDVGFTNGYQHVPSFFGTIGVGESQWGFDLQAFASSAAGRYRAQDPIDRLALDAYGVVRPAFRVRPGDFGYAVRVLRTLGGELGLGLERDGRSMSSGSRFTIHLGARVELPLTPAGRPSELRLRLAVRRSLGLYTPKLYGASAADVTEVGDTALELYSALVFIF